ncbi:MAG TPA: glycoside hydrolase family 11 protein [Polyangiaceae bacterium]|nr:glycoside hydrolase family 11 protein [Polyangiaceae bacterium]
MLQRTFGIGVALGMLNCAGNGATTDGPQSGGATGMPSSGGSATAGGSSAVSVGGESTVDDRGGATGLAEGGASPSGGKAASSGNAQTGGRAATSSKASGGAATGGSASGSISAVGGSSATGGAGAGGGATGGATGTSTTPSEVACNAVMPTGGQTYTGSSVNGTINGLNYGIWTNGAGGDITVFSDAKAFSTSWNESKNFLAHLGLDFWGSAAKAYTAFGTITAQFVEKKSGTAGQFSMIGIYGWTQNPCVEWYINEDSYNGLYGGGSVTATIDGGTYSLSSTTTTGTEGANACESGHTGPWTQIKSTRKTARQCGTVTVSEHFAEWEKQGWSLGKLTMVHINVEVGGGTGSIDFPVANVTTTSK